MFLLIYVMVNIKTVIL